MDLVHTHIDNETAFELILKSRSVEMHSRMQQLTDAQKSNILDLMNGTLKSIAHYIILNTTKPG